MTNRLLLGTNKDVVLCIGSLMEAAVQIAELLVRRGEYPDYRLPERYAMTEGHYLQGQDVQIGGGTSIGAFTTLGAGVRIGENCRIGEQVHIAAGTQIGAGVIIKPGARVGTPPFFSCNGKPANDFAGYGRVIIGGGVTIGVNSVIQRGSFSDTVIGEGTGIGDAVVIGHDVLIGRRCRIVSQTGIAGRAELGDDVTVMGQVGIVEDVRIGTGAIINGKSLIPKNVPEYEVVSGTYGRKHLDELRLQAKLRRLV